MRRLAVTGFALALAHGCTAQAASPPARGAIVKAPDASASRAQPSSPQTLDGDGAPRNVVAKARMLECGHQWSNLKRAGTASGTWKEFSRGCLAQK